jgi:hypothetical protein
MLLVLSSVAAGLIATFVMILFLYLPLLWRGSYFDVLGALGSFRSGHVDARSRLIGALVYTIAGVIFAYLYGWIALMLFQSNPALNFPSWALFPNSPTEINLLFPVFGLAIGFGHGIIASLLLTVIIIEYHPIEHFHTRYILVLSQIISHLVFGVTVMFFQSQFLQLLLGRGAGA